MSSEIIGYASSLILLVTVCRHIVEQWRSGSSKGVSVWLFIGQFLAASVFTVYSVLTGSKVFAMTNACTAVAAVVGLGIVLHQRWKNRSAPIGIMEVDLPRKYAV